MTFEQFKYVLEIAKTGSMNQAANNLFASQAALSLAVKSLEQEVGEEIFLRTNRGMQLTSFGRNFVSYITPICKQMAQLEQTCRKEKDGEHMSLSVSSNGYRFVALVCAKLYERYKSLGIHIHHLDGIGDSTIDYVARQQVDVGIVRIWDCYKTLYNHQFAAKQLEFFPLAKVHITIMVGRGSPLFQLGQDSISAGQLKDYPLVVPDYLYTGPYSDIFSRLNLPPARNKIITSSRAVIYDTLENTDAYYVSSDSRLGYRNHDSSNNTRSFVLEDCPIKSEIGWVKHEDYAMTPVAKEFVREITRLFQE